MTLERVKLRHKRFPSLRSMQSLKESTLILCSCSTERADCAALTPPAHLVSASADRCGRAEFVGAV